MRVPSTVMLVMLIMLAFLSLGIGHWFVMGDFALFLLQIVQYSIVLQRILCAGPTPTSEDCLSTCVGLVKFMSVVSFSALCHPLGSLRMRRN